MKRRAVCIVLALLIALQGPAAVSNVKAAEAAEVEVNTLESAGIETYEKEIVKITKTGFVADSYNGVDAVYRKGGSDGCNMTYSCAAYVKKYYSAVHKVTVNNLNRGCTPKSSTGKFKVVKTPKEGDVVYCPTSSGSTHWAIVKHVDTEEKEVVLIEQNYKWQQGGQTVCAVNRSISWSDGKFFRLSR